MTSGFNFSIFSSNSSIFDSVIPYFLFCKFSTCYKTLVELGVERKNMIFLFNKSESLDDKKLLHVMNNLKIDEVENCLDVSALTGKNLTDLKQILQERFYGKTE